MFRKRDGFITCLDHFKCSACFLKYALISSTPCSLNMDVVLCIDEFAIRTGFIFNVSQQTVNYCYICVFVTWYCLHFSVCYWYMFDLRKIYQGVVMLLSFSFVLHHLQMLKNYRNKFLLLVMNILMTLMSSRMDRLGRKSKYIIL